MVKNSLERITPTRENLSDFFSQFPDHQQRYEFTIKFLQPDFMVADVACGVGYGSWLMSKQCAHVFGVDISPDALAHARSNFQESNINFMHADEFKFSKKFDLIISFETIEHMDEAEGDDFLKNLRENLKSNGALVISTPINKTNNKNNVTEFHVREYDDYEFPEKLKKNGFEVVDMYGQGSDFHKKLYGAGNKIGLFRFIKLGFHRFLPSIIRNYIKNILLGSPNEGLSIKKEDWRSSMIQIAVCKINE